MIKDISFEITKRCLNNCLHCSSCSSATCEQYIDYETIIKTIDDMSRLGVMRVCLSGGEPFLHKDLQKIVKHINNLGMDVNIYSSGIVENDEQISCISFEEFSKLKSLGLTKVMFNVQSTKEEHYNIITGTKNRFRIVKESIYNAIQSGISAEIHFVPMKINVEDIDSVVSFAKEMKIDKVSFLKLVPHGRASENKHLIQLSSGETMQLRKKLSEINSKNIRIGIPLSLNFESDFCHAASSKLYIKFDGNVYGCEAFKYIQQLDPSNNTIQPCNIFESNLFDIFNNSEYIRATQDFVKKYSLIDSKCESCPVQKYLELKRGKN